MRKRIIKQDPAGASPPAERWLDLEHLAQVELTSENPSYPIEAALSPGAASEWRADRPGEQTIRLLFDRPQQIRRVYLVFQENEQERTHEFVLRWSSDGGHSFREIVRQQYNFNPSDTTQEVEDLTLELHGVTTIELTIIPDISGRDVRASVAQLLLA
ncbi:hypothetical protein ACFL27_16320 [candidate division CSSED10-310 bacterium]|uniref:Carbohydrate-binding protein n=1 Tax=candidate division CSSED10-310 bacterium TaxID=2855610 RepID=A0ABV6YZX7_UNCC1